jgi:signal transduction histidine kinase/ligand-binding sensor domain-containing protein
MWFGTEKGLNRYDGTSLTVFKHESGNPHSIVLSRVQSLCEDRQGILWVGTWRGLDKLDRASNTFTHYLPNPQAQASTEEWSNVIYTIFEDKHGTLWASGKGLMRFNRAASTFTSMVHHDDSVHDYIQNIVDAVYEDRSGTLWVGAAGALEKFDRSTGKYTQYWIDPNILKGGAPDYGGFHWIQKIYEDRHGVLWLCTNGGPVAFYRATEAFKPYYINRAMEDSSAAQSVSSILEDNAGVLWIGTWGGGLLTYDAHADSFVSHPLDPSLAPFNSVSALYKDRAGTIWVGTNGDGVLKVVQPEKRFTAIRHDPNNSASLQNNDVRFIFQFPFESKSVVYIGTATGPDTFDPKKGILPRAATPERPFSITGGLISRTGTIYTGVEGDGFNKVTLRPYRRKYFSTRDAGLGGSACSMFEDRLGRIWMLTCDVGLPRTTPGLCQFDPKTETFKSFAIGISQPFVAARMIVEDSVDNTPLGWALWIGTNDGLWRYDARHDAFEQFEYSPKDPSSLASNTVTTIFKDSHGTLWIGTDRGLNRLDSKTGGFKKYTEDNGLPDKTVLGILEDKRGRIWVSTQTSIAKLDARLERFTRYSMQDVLPSLRFSAGCSLRGSAGEMYFGGNGGFVLFYPDSIEDNQYVPPVVITGFKKFDRQQLLDSVISEKRVVILSHGDNVFSFEFAVLNFTNPEMNQHAYMLEGHDAAWSYCGTQQYARYLNVEPGSYIFRVKGSNNDGVWNEEGTSITVIITPPFWATWWFRTFAFVGLLVSVGGSIRYIEKKKLMKRIEQLEQERALERERARISQDMHDEVGSSLSEIAILSELAKQKPEEAGTHVQEISERASEVIDSVSEIVWAMNPKNDTLDNLVAHLRRYAVKYLNLAQINCKFNAPDVIPAHHLTAEVRRNLFLVVKEALHNVVKHSRASEVSINAELGDSAITIALEDNGRGFSVDERLPSGNGLANMDKRIADIGGKFKVVSQPGKGTRVEMRIPNYEY